MKVTISSGRIQLFDLLKNLNPVISDAIFTSNIIKYTYIRCIWEMKTISFKQIFEITKQSKLL